MNITGIILAGGKSKRLEFNKLEIKIDGVPLFIDQVFKLSYFCSEILIVTSKKNYPFLYQELSEIGVYKELFGFDERDLPSLKIITDIGPDTGTFSEEIGPITGLYTGLKNTVNFYSIVLAFDMPFVSFRLFKMLVDLLEKETTGYKDAYVIRTEKGYEALCAVYSGKCIKSIEESMMKGTYKISDMFTQLDMEIIKPEDLKSSCIDDLTFFNINSTSDYNRFIHLWKNLDKTNFADKWGKLYFR